ncbi:MAG: protein kinase domain-containing protein [Deltaproteobacteria bacterium]
MIRKIGEGGMGNVYQVEHVMLRKRMAMKMLRPEYSQNPDIVGRFQNEAVAAGSIGQENIVSVTDFGSTPGGLVYLVMEELQGCALADTIAKERQLPLGRALHIAEQISRALAAAHAAGIVHRDLKPDNIFILDREKRDFVKVLDFGISKIADLGDGGRVTRTGMIIGTPEYMSPEQSAGRPVDHRTDVYALGIVLYEMLTGRLPFTADNPVAMLMKHQTEPPAAFAQARPDLAFPSAVERFVRSLLAKKVEERVQGMAACLSAIQALQADQPKGSEPRGAATARVVAKTLVSTPAPVLRPTDRLKLSAMDIRRAELSTEEGFLASRLGPGGSTVDEIAQLSGLTRPRALELLAGMLAKGVLELDAKSPAAASPPTAKAAPTPAGRAASPSAAVPPEKDDVRERRGLLDKNPMVNRFVRKQMLVQRGREELARGHPKEALSHLGAALALDPRDPEIKTLIHDIQARHDEGEAEQSFREGVEAESRRDFDGALSHFRRAMSLHPQNPRYLERVARKLLYRDGEIKEAKRLSERAVELAPGDAEARATLARAYLQAGLKAKAKRELEHVLQLQKDHRFAKSQIKRFRWWSLSS